MCFQINVWCNEHSGSVTRRCCSNRSIKKGVLIHCSAQPYNNDKPSRVCQYCRRNGHFTVMGKPVQIVSLDPNKSEGYCVARDELERIFAHPQVAKTPVSIYSIAGAYRKGKSFMLSFFLRYLSSGNSDSWLDSKDDKLVDGFPWRGGAERHTQGIWIWDEPFFVETPQGKTALFLMDTQGAYDPNSSVKDCSAIFALSTFMSSVQVYNVKEQIQEDTLQNFQLFTEYAKAAKQNGKDLQEPFQILVFLIRDWQDTSYDYGLDGGQKVLNELLQPQVLNHDTESVRKSLRNSFQTIKCCLMPHPGFAVAERKQDDGDQLSLKDIREVFLKNVDALVRNIFTPDRLVMKKVNNKVVSGIDFINFTLRYFEQLSSGKMPKVETIYEATAKAALLSACEGCIAAYEALMKEGSLQVFHTMDSLLFLHDKSKDQVLNDFEEQHKLGDEKLIAEHRTYLIQKISGLFSVYESKYRAILAEIKRIISEVLNNIKQEYAQSLSKKSGGEYVDEKNLTEVKQISHNEALEKFEQMKETLPDNLVEENRSKLLEILEEMWREFFNNNKQKLCEIQNSIKLLSMKAFEMYKKLMDQECEKFLSDEEFAEAHRIATKKALDEFDDSLVGKNMEIKLETRQLLLCNIEDAKKNLKKSIEAKRQRSANLEKARIEYRTNMNDIRGDEPMDVEELTESHEGCKTKAKAFICNDQSSMSEFDELVEHEFSDMKKSNLRLQNKAIAEFGQNANEAFEMYSKRMNEVKDGFCAEEELEKLHSTAKKQAMDLILTKTKKHRQFRTQEFKSIETQLEQDIEARYQRACETNQSHKKKLDELGESTVANLLATYKDEMNNIREGVYVEQELLLRIHNNFVARAKEDIQNKLDRFLEIKKKWQQDCMKKLKDHFETTKIENQKAKPICPRIRKSQKGDMGVKQAIATGLGGCSGAAAGAKLGAMLGSGLGPPGAALGALIGAETGYATAVFVGWAFG